MPKHSARKNLRCLAALLPCGFATARSAARTSMSNSIFENLSQDISGLANGIVRTVSGGASGVLNGVAGTTKFIGTSLNGAVDATALAASSASMDVRMAGARALRSQDNVSSAVTHTATVTKDAVGTVSNAAVDGTVAVVGGTRQVVVGVYTPIRPAAEAVGNGLVAVGSAAKSGVEVASEKAAPTLRSVGTAAAAAAEPVGKVSKEAGKAVANAAKGTVNTTLGVGASVVGAAGRTVGLTQ